MRIFKYPMNPRPGKLHIDMPSGAQVLSVGVQDLPRIGQTPVLWALVDPDRPLERVHFRIVGTGEEFVAKGHAYRGTFHLTEQALVFHLFEDLKRPQQLKGGE